MPSLELAGERSLTALWIEPQCNANSGAVLSAVALSAALVSGGESRAAPSLPGEAAHLILKMSSQRGEGSLGAALVPDPQ